MKMQTLGDKPNFVDTTVKNDESSATISRGQPISYKLDGTDDGLGVVLPGTNGASLAQTLFAGVALQDIAYGRLGNARIYGISPYTIVTRATRAASSDSWSSSQSIASGVLMSLDTINNAFLLGATVGASGFLAGAALAQSIASMAASATATSDTRTVITAAVRTFVRAM